MHVAYFPTHYAASFAPRIGLGTHYKQQRPRTQGRPHGAMQHAVYASFLLGDLQIEQPFSN